MLTRRQRWRRTQAPWRKRYGDICDTVFAEVLKRFGETFLEDPTNRDVLALEYLRDRTESEDAVKGKDETTGDEPLSLCSILKRDTPVRCVKPASWWPRQRKVAFCKTVDVWLIPQEPMDDAERECIWWPHSQFVENARALIAERGCGADVGLLRKCQDDETTNDGAETEESEEVYSI